MQQTKLIHNMPEASFYFNSTYNKCSIDPTEINSVGGPDNPKLQVWLNLELDPGEGKNLQAYILTSIEARFRVLNSPFDIATGTTTQYCKVNRKYSWKLMLEFEFSAYKILKIEERRIDNLKSSISLNFRAIYFDSISLPSVSSKKEVTVMTDMSQSQCNIELEIPQSLWITKLLPGLGWKPSRLIELPSAIELIPEEYSQSLGELDKANEYYLRGDYDKVVAHCRSAIDPIKASWKDLKQVFKSESENKWIDAINTGTSDWLDTMINSTYQLCSKTHHNRSIGHFDRHSSQVILMITTAIIGYAGKCISDNSTIK